MKHIDLFSGIGGFALAVDRVFGKSEHIFCDNDPFCQQVLKKHWPKSKIYGDIRQLITDAGSQKSRRISSCDLLTGGFPCQPFSQAGSRKGTEDNRYLWPEMFKIIQFAKPAWIVAENVGGLVTWNDGMVLEQVCTDLENQGYEVQPFIIPAASLGAPHRRDRIWIIAHSTSYRRFRKGSPASDEKRYGKGSEQARKLEGRSEGSYRYASDSESAGGKRRSGKKYSQRPENGEKWSEAWIESQGRSWDRNWLEVATELCGVDDGLPAELDGFKLTKAGHRTQRLKSLGNAIVPQVAEQILKAIKTYEHTRKN